MKISLYILMLFTLLLMAGCSSEKSAATLLETAQFEEKQHNREHAEKLYREIIAKYPGTPAASTAAQRLGALGSSGKP